MGKDHFVPRHYLRQFAVVGTTEIVIAADVSPFRFLGPKGIAGQCQEIDFEEGDEKLASLLKVAENDLAPVLVAVTRKESFTGPELSALKLFASILHVRTRKAAEAHKVFPKRIAYEFVNSAIKMGELPPPPGGEWTEDMVDFKGVPALLVQNARMLWLEMNTLECKFLKAPEGNCFITSDNPVAVLNQFGAGADRLRNFVGFAQAGFQLFLPISPRLCLIFYDAQVYKVGSMRHRVISISATDVEIVNSFQIQSSDRRVYFNDQRFEPEVQRLVRLYERLRVPVKDGLVTLPGPNDNEEFLLFRQLTVKIPKPWQFCKVRRHVKSNVGDRRNPAWSAVVAELMKDFDKNPEAGDIDVRIQKILADPNSLKNIRLR